VGLQIGDALESESGWFSLNSSIEICFRYFKPSIQRFVSSVHFLIGVSSERRRSCPSLTSPFHRLIGAARVLGIKFAISCTFFDDKRIYIPIYRYFTSAFPVGIATCLLFWGLYYANPEMVMPAWIAKLIPPWYNQVN
jgi:hypothetical protein